MSGTRGMVLGLGLVCALCLRPVMGQAPSFDHLSDADRQVFQQRFEKEVWPLLQRGGKDGCVGCHSQGKIVSSLRFRGDAGKDFAMLLKEGFFLPDDAGSLLSRVTDPDPKRRMPPGKLPAWSEADIKVLRTFVADLDRKQK